MGRKPAIPPCPYDSGVREAHWEWLKETNPEGLAAMCADGPERLDRYMDAMARRYNETAQAIRDRWEARPEVQELKNSDPATYLDRAAMKSRQADEIAFAQVVAPSY